MLVGLKSSCPAGPSAMAIFLQHRMRGKRREKRHNVAEQEKPEVIDKIDHGLRGRPAPAPRPVAATSAATVPAATPKEIGINVPLGKRAMAVSHRMGRDSAAPPAGAFASDPLLAPRAAGAIDPRDFSPFRRYFVYAHVPARRTRRRPHRRPPRRPRPATRCARSTRGR